MERRRPLVEERRLNCTQTRNKRWHGNQRKDFAALVLCERAACPGDLRKMKICFSPVAAYNSNRERGLSPTLRQATARPLLAKQFPDAREDAEGCLKCKSSEDSLLINIYYNRGAHKWVERINIFYVFLVAVWCSNIKSCVPMLSELRVAIFFSKLEHVFLAFKRV